MVAIYGPSCRSRPVADGRSGILFPALEPLIANAATLAEALATYTREHSVKFRPYDGSATWLPMMQGEPAKYFWYEKPDGHSSVVDIHVERNGEFICPKQDLTFPLQPADKVHIGPLAGPASSRGRACEYQAK